MRGLAQLADQRVPLLLGQARPPAQHEQPLIDRVSDAAGLRFVDRLDLDPEPVTHERAAEECPVLEEADLAAAGMVALFLEPASRRLVERHEEARLFGVNALRVARVERISDRTEDPALPGVIGSQHRRDASELEKARVAARYHRRNLDRGQSHRSTGRIVLESAH
jgi:hypothetical protein